MPKLLRAICVVGLGLCAALPFRRSTPRPRADQDSTAQSQPLLLQENPETVDLSAVPTNSAEPTGNYSPRTVVTPIGMSDAGADDFPSTTTLIPAAAPVTVPTDPFPVAVDTTDPFPAPVDPAVITHLLTTHDTLRKLAEKYLGNRTRWQEFLKLNSRLLPNPYQLPVGTRILIPRRMDTVSRKPQPPPDSRPPHLLRTRPTQPVESTASSPQEAAPLVPVVRSPAVVE